MSAQFKIIKICHPFHANAFNYQEGDIVEFYNFNLFQQNILIKCMFNNKAITFYVEELEPLNKEAEEIFKSFNLDAILKEKISLRKENESLLI